MTRIDGSLVYGEVTDRFDACIAHALQVAASPMKRKRIPAVLLAALITLLIAGGAVAIASKVGLLDLLPWFQGEQMDHLVTPVVDQTIANPMKGISFTGQEAYYDGQRVYYVIEAVPTAQDTVLAYGARLLAEDEQEARMYGNTVLGVTVQPSLSEASIPRLGLEAHRNGASILLVGTAELVSGFSPDVLEVHLTLGSHASGYDAALEQSEMTLRIPKTTEPSAQAYTGTFVNDLLSVESVSLTYTPLELSITVSYQPLLAACQGLRYVVEGSPVNSDVRDITTQIDMATGQFTDRFVIQPSGALPKEILLWVVRSEDVLILDTGTQTISMRKASLVYQDDGSVTLSTPKNERE